MTALIAAALFVAGRPTWWRGFTAAGIAAAASLVVCFAIVLPMFGRATATLAYAFLVAGAARAAAMGTMVVIAIKQGGHPQDATLALAGIFYIAIVSIEGYVLWSLTDSTHAATDATTRATTRASTFASTPHATFASTPHATQDRA